MGVCYRLRHVLYRAPWSVFDLALAIGVLSISVYLLLKPDLFAHFYGVYSPMSSYADQNHWGMVFLLSGAFSSGVVLWPFRPHFLLRVLARMLTAFCMLSFAMNNLANDPPPASAFFYSVMALFAIWAVIRTRCDG